MAHTHTTPRRMAGPTIAHLVVADSSHPHPMAHQEPLPGLSPCLAHPRVGKTDAAAAQPWKPERNAACSGCDALDSSLAPFASCILPSPGPAHPGVAPPFRATLPASPVSQRSPLWSGTWSHSQPRAFSSHFPHGRYTSGLWWLNAALH